VRIKRDELIQKMQRRKYPNFRETGGTNTMYSLPKKLTDLFEFAAEMTDTESERIAVLTVLLELSTFKQDLMSAYNTYLTEKRKAEKEKVETN